MSRRKNDRSPVNREEKTALSADVTVSSSALPSGASTAANQAALNALLPASIGRKTKAGSLSVVRASNEYALSPEDLAALGHYGDDIIVAYRSGRNTDVDLGTFRELWYGTAAGGPALRVLPTAAQTHSWVSTSAQDSAAGTGLRTILVDYLDGSDNLAQQVVALNGVTPVSMTGTVSLILGSKGVSCGSGTGADGVITCTAVTDGTMQAAIPVGETITRLGAYKIPSGYTGLFRGADVSISNANAGAVVGVLVEVLAFGTTCWNQIGETRCRCDSSGIGKIRLGEPYPIPEKSVIRLVGFSDTNNSQISCMYSMKLVKNTWQP